MYIWILRILALVFLIWFIVPVFKNYFNHGNKLGILMCLFVLLFYTNTPLFEYVKALCFSHPVLTVLWNIAAVLIYAFIFYAVSVTLMMIIFSLIKPKKDATAVVLGNRADKDGPSPLLKGRIDATKRYLDKNENAVAILSGGKCKKDYTKESECMYNELVNAGVEENRLIQEDKSRSTYENILFSYRIIREHNYDTNLAIATDFFHQLRARLVIRKLGIKTKVGSVNSRTSFLYIPTYCVREWIALCYELLFRFRPHRQ